MNYVLEYTTLVENANSVNKAGYDRIREDFRFESFDEAIIKTKELENNGLVVHWNLYNLA